MVTALRGGHSAVTVYGPSGCGKSSLAVAGVVPRMRRDGHEVLVVDVGRTSSLRAALATELFTLAVSGRYGVEQAQQADPDRIRRWLDKLGLTDTFHRVTGQQGTSVLVVLDQAEALLNLSEPEIGQDVALLFPERRTDGFQVLLTLRADFMDAALSHPELGPALRHGTTLPLTPMTRDQLHAVITEPIRRIPGVEYDPGLDQRILDDTARTPESSRCWASSWPSCGSAGPVGGCGPKRTRSWDGCPARCAATPNRRGRPASGRERKPRRACC